MENMAAEERFIIREDFNRHVGTSKDRVERIPEGFGFRRANSDGGRVQDFAVSYDLAIANTFFCNREEHYITYMSGVN